MPNLKEPKHELFARALAEGKGVHLASGLAGYHSPQYSLRQNDVIQARVAEILKESESDAIMKAREWRERETRSARVDIRDFFDMTTNFLLPMSQWSNEAAEAVESIEWDKYGQPKIKLRKTSSMNNLGKSLGVLTDKVELSGPNGGPVKTINNEMTPQQAAEVYALLLNPGS